MNQRDEEAGVVGAELARAELYETLGQLKDRLNYAQRFDDAVYRTKQRIVREQRENPVGFAAGAGAVAVVAGLAVWGVARIVVKRFT